MITINVVQIPGITLVNRTKVINQFYCKINFLDFLHDDKSYSLIGTQSTPPRTRLIVPTGQGSQRLIPALEVNVPGSQGKHMDEPTPEV